MWLPMLAASAFTVYIESMRETSNVVSAQRPKTARSACQDGWLHESQEKGGASADARPCRVVCNRDCAQAHVAEGCEHEVEGRPEACPGDANGWGTISSASLGGLPAAVPA